MNEQGNAYWRITGTADEPQVEFPLWENLQFSPKQWEYLRGKKKREIVVCGRGAGKSHCVLLKKIIRAFEKYAKRAKDKKWNRPGPLWHLAIVCPTEANYMENWLKALTYVPKVPGVAVDGKPNYSTNEKDGVIRLFGENGILISFWSAWSPGTLRGPGFDDCLCDEAMLMKLSTFLSNVVPMVFRPGYEGWMTLSGTPDTEEIKSPWFDNACDEADPERSEDGYCSDYTLYSWTPFDNPLLDDSTKKQIEKLKKSSPARYAREVLAERHIVLPPEVAPNCPITDGLISMAYTQRPVRVEGAVMVSWDLAYGGADDLVRVVWNVGRRAIMQIDVWGQADARIDTANPHQSIAKFLEKTADEFPGCLQVYDATGKYGCLVMNHVHPRVRCKPRSRNNTVKNRDVQNLIERMANTDAQGKSLGVEIPDPGRYQFKDQTQRNNMRYLVESLQNYQLVTEVRRDGSVREYWKIGGGYKDHIIDAVTMGLEELPAMGTRVNRASPMEIARALQGR